VRLRFIALTHVLFFCMSSAVRASGIARAQDAEGHGIVGVAISVRSHGVFVPIGVTDKSGTLRTKLPFDECKAVVDRKIVAQAVADDSGCLLTLAISVIGNVVVRSNVPSVSDSSLSAIASGSLGSGAAFDVGQRPGALGGPRTRVNGVPLSLPGFPGGGGAVSADLLDSISVESGDDGQLVENYQLPSPTLVPTRRAKAVVGDYGVYSLRSAYTGTSKRLGVSAVTSVKHDDGILSGLYFRDLSGVAYNHSLNEYDLAYAGTLTYNAGKLQLTVTEIGSKGFEAHVDTNAVGHLAYGEGPNVSSAEGRQFGFVRADYIADQRYTSALAVVYGGDYDVNGSRRLQFGAISPLSSLFGYSGFYDELSLTQKAKNVQVGADVIVTRTSFRGSNGFSAYTDAIGSSSAVLRSTIGNVAALQLKAKVSLENRFGIANDPGIDSNLSLSHSKGPFSASAVLASERSDTASEQIAYSQEPVTPLEATYDCDAKAIGAPVSSVLNGRSPRTNRVQASIAQVVGSVKISVGAIAATTINDYVRTFIALGTVQPGDAYFDSLSATYGEVCSTPTVPALFINRYEVDNTTTRQLSVEASTKIAGLMVRANYERYRYSAVEQTQRGQQTFQVPNVPLERSNLLVGRAVGRATLAVAATYVSRNNENNLPAYIETYAGVQEHLRHATMTFSITNLGKAFDFRLQSTRRSMQQPASIGSAPVLSSPLQPTWRLSIATSP